MTDPVEARAEEIIKARGFNGLSDMIATLVREEYERRNPPALQETALPYKISSVGKTMAEDQADQALKKHQRRDARRRAPGKTQPT